MNLLYDIYFDISAGFKQSYWTEQLYITASCQKILKILNGSWRILALPLQNKENIKECTSLELAYICCVGIMHWRNMRIYIEMSWCWFLRKLHFHAQFHIAFLIYKMEINCDGAFRIKGTIYKTLRWKKRLDAGCGKENPLFIHILNRLRQQIFDVHSWMSIQVNEIVPTGRKKYQKASSQSLYYYKQKMFLFLYTQSVNDRN